MIFKASELKDSRWYLDVNGYLWLFPQPYFWQPNNPNALTRTAPEEDCNGDTLLTGPALIAELRKRGVTVVEDGFTVKTVDAAQANVITDSRNQSYTMQGVMVDGHEISFAGTSAPSFIKVNGVEYVPKVNPPTEPRLNLAEQVANLERHNLAMEAKINERNAEINILQKNIGDGVSALPNHTQLRWPSVDFKDGGGLASAIKCVTKAYLESAAKPRTFTAREWLEMTLPKGGEWRSTTWGCGDIDVWHHFGEQSDGTLYANGILVGSVVPPEQGTFGPIISRDQAIDLMVKAIEGEQINATSEAKPETPALDYQSMYNVEHHAAMDLTTQVKILNTENGELKKAINELLDQDTRLLNDRVFVRQAAIALWASNEESNAEYAVADAAKLLSALKSHEAKASD